MPDTILEGNHARIISAKFGWNWLSSFRGEDFFLISSPLFLFLAWFLAILVGSRDHRTQFWKGAIQGPFHQSLVTIGPVVSDKKIFMGISHRVLCYLSLAVVGILVGGLKCCTQIWKGTIQGSFQQSLVEIGSVVSEEKTFFNFIPPFF